MEEEKIMFDFKEIQQAVNLANPMFLEVIGPEGHIKPVGLNTQVLAASLVDRLLKLPDEKMEELDDMVADAAESIMEVLEVEKLSEAAEKLPEPYVVSEKTLERVNKKSDEGQRGKKGFKYGESEGPMPFTWRMAEILADDPGFELSKKDIASRLTQEGYSFSPNTMGAYVDISRRLMVVQKAKGIIGSPDEDVQEAV